MDQGAYWLPVYMAIVMSRVLYSFGPTKRGRFIRTFPGRCYEELVSIVGSSVALSLFPLAGLAQDRGNEWPMLLIGLLVVAGATITLLLARHARRAGEPSWEQWKGGLPPSPAAAAG